ncbi:MAG: response regulator transcription factor [Acidobacteria bacterium]|nr:response regulator transcription factor [Acidobacteriota bacterium]
MAKTILVVEDDDDLCDLLDYNLSRAGYKVRVMKQVAGTLEAAERIVPDLILLDVMLPDGDGFDVCRSIRGCASLADTPILFLTARGEEVDRILGLEIGGDDYITKPFSPRELVARVKAHLRRQSAPVSEATTRLGPLEIDSEACKAFVNGKEIALTATEFRLLEFFIAHPGRVHSREALLETIWGQDRNVTPRNVDVHVRRLREQIEESPQDPKWLQTVRGFGYRFELPA